VAQHLADSREAGAAFDAVFAPDEESSPAQQAVIGTLVNHMLGPLFMEYENTIKALEKELRERNGDVTRQGEDIRTLISENEELNKRIEVQNRGYLKLVEETRDNADILAMRSISGEPHGPGLANGSDELKDMRERIHLLTEEN
jgi:hypothetical protein